MGDHVPQRGCSFRGVRREVEEPVQHVHSNRRSSRHLRDAGIDRQIWDTLALQKDQIARKVCLPRRLCISPFHPLAENHRNNDLYWKICATCAVDLSARVASSSDSISAARVSTAICRDLPEYRTSIGRTHAREAGSFDAFIAVLEDSALIG